MRILRDVTFALRGLYLAGRTLISLSIMKGVPAKTSTSRSSTTKASRESVLLSHERVMWVSPLTASGVMPSA